MKRSVVMNEHHNYGVNLFNYLMTLKLMKSYMIHKL